MRKIQKMFFPEDQVAYAVESDKDTLFVPAGDRDGWITHHGNEKPRWLDDDQPVQFVLDSLHHGGGNEGIPAGMLHWGAPAFRDSAIVKFRPVLPSGPFAEALAPTPGSRGDRPAFPPDTKPTNPKDAVAGAKVPLDLLSPVAMAHWAAGQHAGNAKYGLVNYRVAGASARVYLGGALRHIQRYLAGQRDDPIDKAHNLGMAMANLAIVLDCEAAGTLTDDRPYPVPLDATYEEVERVIAGSNERYKDRNPKHYTIADAKIAPPKTDPDAGWIPNTGQEPAGLPAKYEVKLRQGDVHPDTAVARWDWSLYRDVSHGTDIVAWRPRA